MDKENTLIQELVRELLSAKNPAEKAAIAAEFCLSGLPEEIARIARRCVLFHWFDQTMIGSLLQMSLTVQLETSQIYEQIQALPFVETHPWGLRFQDLTRQGLLQRYARTQPDLLRQAATLGVSAYAKQQDDKKIGAELLFCSIVAGDYDMSAQLLHSLQAWGYTRNDWHYLRNLLQMQEEAESFSFVHSLPIDEDGWMLRGLVSQSKGEQEQAISSYSKALAINPRNALAHIHRGTAYAELLQLKKALSDYDQALQITPDLGLALVGRGTVFIQMGDYSSALNEFNAAIRQNAEDPSLYYTKGTILHMLDDDQGALAAFDEVLRLDSYYADAYREKGTILNEQGRHQEALAMFDEALQLDPYHADAYRGKGKALSELKQYEKASLAYEEAESLEPETISKDSEEFVFSQEDGNMGERTDKKAPFPIRVALRRRNDMGATNRPRQRSQSIDHIQFSPVWGRAISGIVAAAVILVSLVLFYHPLVATLIGSPSSPTATPTPTATKTIQGVLNSPAPTATQELAGIQTPQWIATFDSSSDSLVFNNYHVTNLSTTHFLIIYMTFTNTTSQSQAMNSSRLFLIDVNDTRYYEDPASNPWITFNFSPKQTAQLVTAYVVPDNICQYGLIFLDPTGQTRSWIITINPNYCTGSPPPTPTP